MQFWRALIGPQTGDLLYSLSCRREQCRLADARGPRKCSV